MASSQRLMVFVFICLGHTFTHIRGQWKQPGNVDPCEPINCAGLTSTEDIPYPGNCTLYYKCNGDVLEIGTCSPGTLFDNARFQCNLEATVLQEDTCHPACPTTTITTTTTTPTSTTPPMLRVDPCDPGVCDKDSFYALYADPNSCQSFYECATTQLYHRNCPQGTLFDSVLLICDHVSSVMDAGRCQPACDTILGPAPCPASIQCPTSTETLILPDPTNCQYYFSYPCDTHEPERIACAKNRLFDKNELRCRKKGNVNNDVCLTVCPTEPTFSTSEFGSLTLPTTNFSPIESAPCPEDIVCTNQDDVERLPDPLNCNIYYNFNCRNKTYTADRCPNGRTFSHINSKCISTQSDNHCREPCSVAGLSTSTPEVITVASTKVPTVDATTIEAVMSTSSPKPVDACNIECTLGSQYSIFGDTSDCSVYYTCQNGIVTPRSCPTGSLFHSEGCMTSTDVSLCQDECPDETTAGKIYTTHLTSEDVQTTNQELLTIEGVITTRQIAFSTEGPTTSQAFLPTTFLNPCNQINCSDYTGVVAWFADPSDCSRYYECVASERVLHHCGNDLLLDYVEKKCSPSDEVLASGRCQPPCPEVIYSTAGPQSTVNVQSEETTAGTTTSPPTSTSAQRTTYGVAETTGNVVYTTVGSTATSTTADPCSLPHCNSTSQNYVAPHPRNCGLYLSCSNGKLTEEACEKGFLFNNAKLGCEDEGIVSSQDLCLSCPTTSAERATSTEAHTFRVSETTANVVYTTVGSTATSTTVDPCSLSHCNSTSQNYVAPHPRNCSLFLSCSNGELTEQTCGSGFLFNSASLGCMDDVIVLSQDFCLKCPTTTVGSVTSTEVQTRVGDVESTSGIITTPEVVDETTTAPRVIEETTLSEAQMTTTTTLQSTTSLVPTTSGKERHTVEYSPEITTLRSEDITSMPKTTLPVTSGKITVSRHEGFTGVSDDFVADSTVGIGDFTLSRTSISTDYDNVTNMNNNDNMEQSSHALYNVTSPVDISTQSTIHSEIMSSDKRASFTSSISRTHTNTITGETAASTTALNQHEVSTRNVYISARTNDNDHINISLTTSSMSDTTPAIDVNSSASSNSPISISHPPIIPTTNLPTFTSDNVAVTGSSFANDNTTSFSKQFTDFVTSDLQNISVNLMSSQPYIPDISTPAENIQTTLGKPSSTENSSHSTAVPFVPTTLVENTTTSIVDHESTVNIVEKMSTQAAVKEVSTTGLDEEVSTVEVSETTKFEFFTKNETAHDLDPPTTDRQPAQSTRIVIDTTAKVIVDGGVTTTISRDAERTSPILSEISTSVNNDDTTLDANVIYSTVKHATTESVRLTTVLDGGQEDTTRPPLQTTGRALTTASNTVDVIMTSIDGGGFDTTGPLIGTTQKAMGSISTIKFPDTTSDAVVSTDLHVSPGKPGVIETTRFVVTTTSEAAPMLTTEIKETSTPEENDISTTTSIDSTSEQVDVIPTTTFGDITTDRAGIISTTTLLETTTAGVEIITTIKSDNDATSVSHTDTTSSSKFSEDHSTIVPIDSFTSQETLASRTTRSATIILTPELISGSTASPVVDHCNLPDICEPNVSAPHTKLCHHYMVCKSATRGRKEDWERKICIEGEYFDSVTLQCVPKEQATCATPCQEKDESPLSNHTLVSSTGVWFEGNPLSFVCTYDLPRKYNSYVTWFLSNMTLSNGSRIQVTSGVHQKAELSEISSRLIFNALRAYDNGLLQCIVHVYDHAGQSWESRLDTHLAVLGKPDVNLLPMSVTTFVGRPLSLTCEATVPETGHADQDNAATVFWFIDGNPVDNNDTEVEFGRTKRSNLKIRFREAGTRMCTCLARNVAGESEKLNTTITVITPEEPVCLSNTEDGITWPETGPGSESIMTCPPPLIGFATRRCTRLESDKAKWEDPNLNHCANEEYNKLVEKVARTEEGLGMEQLNDTVHDLEELSEQVENPGDLLVTVEVLETIVKLRKRQKDKDDEGDDDDEEDYEVEITMKELEDVVSTVSNVLDEMQEENWESIIEEDKYRSVSLMRAIDIFGEIAAEELTDEKNPTITVKENNLLFEAAAVTKKDAVDMTFPTSDALLSMNWEGSTDDRITLKKQTLQNLPEEMIHVSSCYFRALDKLVPVTDPDSYINSRILAVSLAGKRTKLNPPIQLAFTHTEEANDNFTANCTFWNQSLSERGAWSSSGCRRVYDNDTSSHCECDHLTSFSVLMSSHKLEGIHATILTIISVVGCTVSILCLVITILLYVSIWKHVKSHHAVVLINLCIALIIANIVFLAGIDKTSSRVACIVVAGLLHYFYLVAFFTMLVEGVELMLYIVFVFHVKTKGETSLLILAAWAIPGAIVGICMGITETEGYGNDDFCWLTVESGLIWAFVGPVLFVIMTNIIILIIVLRRITKARLATDQEKRRNKVRSAFWNIVVITPILGITWVFGVFAINEDTIYFHYIFAVCNSLQGLFIFIFHALCNKRMKNAKKEKKKAKYALPPPGSSHNMRNARMKSDSSGKSTKTSSLLNGSNHSGGSHPRSGGYSPSSSSSPVQQRGDVGDGNSSLLRSRGAEKPPIIFCPQSITEEDMREMARHMPPSPVSSTFHNNNSLASGHVSDISGRSPSTHSELARANSVFTTMRVDNCIEMPQEHARVSCVREAATRNDSNTSATSGSSC